MACWPASSGGPVRGDLGGGLPAQVDGAGVLDLVRGQPDRDVVEGDQPAAAVGRRGTEVPEVARGGEACGGEVDRRLLVAPSGGDEGAVAEVHRRLRGVARGQRHPGRGERRFHRERLAPVSAGLRDPHTRTHGNVMVTECS